jgi:hypothetical protein
LGQFHVGQIISRGNTNRRGNVIGKATMLIKSENEKGVLPLRRVTNSLIDALDEGFSLGNW